MQTVAQFFTSTGGVSLITIAVAATFAGAALHWLSWRHAFQTLAAGAGMFSASWFVTNWLQT